jgi:hypothetical protein
VVHRTPEREQLACNFGRTASRQDAPVDLRQTELRLFGGEGEVTGEERRVPSAEAPAIDHGDGRLLKPAQPTPPTVRLALRSADGWQALRLVVAEVLLKIHASREGATVAGEHQHADVSTELEVVENQRHLSI